MATAARPGVLLGNGLKPVDRRFESHWVRPGAATAVRLRPDDRLSDLRNAAATAASVIERSR